MRRTVLWLIAAVVLVFLAGFGSGTLAVRKSASAGESTYLKDLTDRYDLSPDQADRIRTLLTAEGAAIDRILDRVEAEVKSEVAMARRSTQDQIRTVLTEAQRTAFDRDRAAPGGGG